MAVGASAAALGADRAVVEAWVTGWALARGTPPPAPVDGGFRIDVGWPDQKVRFVFPSCSAAVERLAERIDEPAVFIKVCAPPEPVANLLPARWTIARLGYMMRFSPSIAPPEARRRVHAEQYGLSLTETDAVVVAELKTSAGETVSSGRVALVGRFAVYDRIETSAGHRRRGLAAGVMRALGQVAAARRSCEGVLVATQEGRALYESLGWRLHSLYTTAVIPPAG